MTIIIGQQKAEIPKKALCLLLDAQIYTSGTSTWPDQSTLGNDFLVNPLAFNSSGPKYMDFNGAYGCAKLASGGILSLVGREQGNATYIVWTRIKNSTAEWRTLTRGLDAYNSSDHNVIIQSSGWNIGMYDNANGTGFNDSGFSQQNLPNYASNGWNMIIFRFSSVAPFYRLSYNDTPGTIRGSNNSSNSAMKFGFNSLGAYGNNVGTDVNNANQYWGDIAWFAAWNRQLTDAECLQVYNTTAPRFFGATQTYDSKITYQDSTTQATAASNQPKGELISITPYVSSGTFTWTRPAGCTKVLVKVTGGGGGAAGYCESGGAGGYAEKEIDVTNTSSVTITVGGGGSSVGYYAGGGNGGTSSFGSFVSASGGYGANQNYSHSGGNGGVGSGGQINLYGGDGSGHGNSHGYYPGGTGGGSFWGGSSTVRRDTTSNKLYSGAPGAGGPGGRTDDGGGGGSAYGESGMVVVYAYK
jgi:hypothetical protein